jgi:hypothetical protein
MNGFDAFIVSFCVAYIVKSDRFKALMSQLAQFVRANHLNGR